MDERNVIDVTSFLLFESTGDSEEANSDHVHDDSLAQEITMAEADDDAQSFTCPNDLCDFDQHLVDDDDDDDSDHGDDENHSHDVVDDDDDGGDEDVIDQVWSSCGKLVLQKKSKVCVDYSKVNERDKDRQFWETCLAS